MPAPWWGDCEHPCWETYLDPDHPDLQECLQFAGDPSECTVLKAGGGWETCSSGKLNSLTEWTPPALAEEA